MIPCPLRVSAVEQQGSQRGVCGRGVVPEGDGLFQKALRFTVISVFLLE